VEQPRTQAEVLRHERHEKLHTHERNPARLCGVHEALARDLDEPELLVSGHCCIEALECSSGPSRKKSLVDSATRHPWPARVTRPRRSYTAGRRYADAGCASACRFTS